MDINVRLLAIQQQQQQQHETHVDLVIVAIVAVQIRDEKMKTNFFYNNPS